MEIKKHLKLFFLTLSIFLFIDFFWLSIIASNFYQDSIGFLLAENPNLIAAAIFYFLFVFGLNLFAIQPGIKDKSPKKTVILGGLFGLICYATYDLTNLATIENWPITVTVVDMFWGTFLGAITSALSSTIYKKFIHSKGL